jgi:hypothetical protein
MFCELLIFTITISRYGYSTCIQICKILQNTDFMYQQWPNSIFISLTLYIRCMKVKLIVHTRIHCISSSQVKCFFICLCSPSVCGENKQIQNTSTWENAVSIMQTFTQFIVHLATLKIGEFFLLKIGFNFFFFFFLDISSWILLTIQTWANIYRFFALKIKVTY